MTKKRRVLSPAQQRALEKANERRRQDAERKRLATAARGPESSVSESEGSSSSPPESESSSTAQSAATIEQEPSSPTSEVGEGGVRETPAPAPNPEDAEQLWPDGDEHEELRRRIAKGHRRWYDRTKKLTPAACIAIEGLTGVDLKKERVSSGVIDARGKRIDREVAGDTALAEAAAQLCAGLMPEFTSSNHPLAPAGETLLTLSATILLSTVMPSLERMVLEFLRRTQQGVEENPQPTEQPTENPAIEVRPAPEESEAA